MCTEFHIIFCVYVWGWGVGEQVQGGTLWIQNFLSRMLLITKLGWLHWKLLGPVLA